MGPVDEIVGLARGMRAIRAAKRTKNIAELTTKELRDAIKKSGNIGDFLKALDKADFDELWNNKKLKDTIKELIRDPSGMHEWIQVSLLPKLMARPDKGFWIDAMLSIRRKIEGKFKDVH